MNWSKIHCLAKQVKEITRLIKKNHIIEVCSSLKLSNIWFNSRLRGIKTYDPHQALMPYSFGHDTLLKYFIFSTLVVNQTNLEQNYDEWWSRVLLPKREIEKKKTEKFYKSKTYWQAKNRPLRR